MYVWVFDTYMYHIYICIYIYTYLLYVWVFIVGVSITDHSGPQLFRGPCLWILRTFYLIILIFCCLL